MTDVTEPKETKADCDFCMYVTLVKEYPVRVYDNGKPVEEYKLLCQVCANTFCGTAAEFPEQYPNKDAMQVIAWGINRILAEIRGEPFISEVEDETPS